MAENLTSDELTSNEATIFRAFNKRIAEIVRLRAAMKKDQMEIERLKAETRSILAQLKAA